MWPASLSAVTQAKGEELEEERGGGIGKRNDKVMVGAGVPHATKVALSTLSV